MHHWQQACKEISLLEGMEAPMLEKRVTCWVWQHLFRGDFNQFWSLPLTERKMPFLVCKVLHLTFTPVQPSPIIHQLLIPCLYLLAWNLWHLRCTAMFGYLALHIATIFLKDWFFLGYLVAFCSSTAISQKVELWNTVQTIKSSYSGEPMLPSQSVASPPSDPQTSSLSSVSNGRPNCHSGHHVVF